MKKGGVPTREIMKEMEMSGWRKEEVRKGSSREEAGLYTREALVRVTAGPDVYRYTPKFSSLT